MQRTNLHGSMLLLVLRHNSSCYSFFALASTGIGVQEENKSWNIYKDTVKGPL